MVASFVGLRDQTLAVLVEEAGPGVSIQGTGHLQLRNLPSALFKTKRPFSCCL